MVMSAVSQFTGLLSMVLPVLIVLGVVVFVHELGHFLVARWCGISVEAFSIGFGPELVAFVDRKGTRWRIAALPLGGYVKFKGDENAASMPDHEALARLTPEQRRGNFHTAPVLYRSLIVAAGPVANFIFAIVIYTLLNMIAGKVIVDPKISAIEPGSPAESAGLKPGDRILAAGGTQIRGFEELQTLVIFGAGQELMLLVDRGGISVPVRVVPAEKDARDILNNQVKIGYLGARGPELEPEADSLEPDGPAAAAGLRAGDRVMAVNDEKIRSFEELQKIIVRSAGQELSLSIWRDGKEITVRVTPAEKEREGPQGEKVKVGYLGIKAPPYPADSHLERYGPVAAFGMALSETGQVMKGPFMFIRDLIAGRAAGKQLSGPLGIAELSAKVAKGGLEKIIRLTAFISVSIGLLNLFPIPVLDGGHLLYYGIEAILGRPMRQEAQEIGFKIGLFLILVLMIFATWNDLSRLFNFSG